MLQAAPRTAQAVSKAVKVLAPVRLLHLFSLRVLVRIRDDLRQAEWRLIDLRDAEILEGVDAGIEREDGLFKGTANGIL
jgi:hypothetical protein